MSGCISLFQLHYKKFVKLVSVKRPLKKVEIATVELAFVKPPLMNLFLLNSPPENLVKF